MKKFSLTGILILFFTTICFSQKTNELTPVPGHYKQLSVFSSNPKTPNEKIDKQKFITDKATIERRMSLKPNYLQNVSVDDFNSRSSC